MILDANLFAHVSVCEFLLACSTLISVCVPHSLPAKARLTLQVCTAAAVVSLKAPLDLTTEEPPLSPLLHVWRRMHVYC